MKEPGILSGRSKSWSNRDGYRNRRDSRAISASRPGRNREGTAVWRGGPEADGPDVEDRERIADGQHRHQPLGLFAGRPDVRGRRAIARRAGPGGAGAAAVRVAA